MHIMRRNKSKQLAIGRKHLAYMWKYVTCMFLMRVNYMLWDNETFTKAASRVYYPHRHVKMTSAGVYEGQKFSDGDKWSQAICVNFVLRKKKKNKHLSLNLSIFRFTQNVEKDDH